MKLMYIIKPVVVAFLVLVVSISCSSETVEHVFIISIDGLRPDALPLAETPNIDFLWQRGAYTWKAQTVMPSVTLPAHASMLTGLLPQKHGINWNFWDSSKGYIKVKTIFEIAKEAGYRTAMFVSKRKLKHLAKPGTLDHLVVQSTDSLTLIKKVISYVIAYRPHLVFIHFGEVDFVGHEYGWLSEEQLEALKEVDEAIGILLDILWVMDMLPKSLIILTSDHGGHGKGHGTALPQDMTIPWVLWGPVIKGGYQIKEPVEIYDTAPTALFVLGLEIPDWDGKSIKEAFASWLLEARKEDVNEDFYNFTLGKPKRCCSGSSS